NAEELTRMDRRGAVEIIQAFHFPGKIGPHQNPSATQSTYAIDLCQAASHQELRSQMERSLRRVLVNCVEINFVHSYERSNAARDIADFTQCRIRREHARRVMQICDHDEPGLWCNATANRFRIDDPAGFFSTVEAVYLCSQIIGNV